MIQPLANDHRVYAGTRSIFKKKKNKPHIINSSSLGLTKFKSLKNENENDRAKKALYQKGSLPKRLHTKEEVRIDN